MGTLSEKKNNVRLESNPSTNEHPDSMQYTPPPPPQPPTHTVCCRGMTVSHKYIN